MQSRERVPLLLPLIYMLAGCATDSVEMAPVQPDRPWTPTTTATGEIIAGQKSDLPSSDKREFVLPANSEMA